MEYRPFIQLGASTYNCGAYGSGAYNETSCTTTGGGGTNGGDNNSGTGGGLADTGMSMIILLAIGITLVIGSLLYLWRSIRKAHQE